MVVESIAGEATASWTNRGSCPEITLASGMVSIFTGKLLAVLLEEPRWTSPPMHTGSASRELGKEVTVKSDDGKLVATQREPASLTSDCDVSNPGSTVGCDCAPMFWRRLLPAKVRDCVGAGKLLNMSVQLPLAIVPGPTRGTWLMSTSLVVGWSVDEITPLTGATDVIGTILLPAILSITGICDTQARLDSGKVLAINTDGAELDDSVSARTACGGSTAT